MLRIGVVSVERVAIDSNDGDGFQAGEIGEFNKKQIFERFRERVDCGDKKRETAAYDY